MSRNLRVPFVAASLLLLANAGYLVHESLAHEQVSYHWHCRHCGARLTHHVGTFHTAHVKPNLPGCPGHDWRTGGRDPELLAFVPWHWLGILLDRRPPPQQPAPADAAALLTKQPD